MLRSIATVSLGGTLMEKLNAIAAAGFDGVEIFENDLLYFDGPPSEVKRICSDLGRGEAPAEFHCCRSWFHNRAFLVQGKCEVWPSNRSWR